MRDLWFYIFFFFSLPFLYWDIWSTLRQAFVFIFIIISVLFEPFARWREYGDRKTQASRKFGLFSGQKHWANIFGRRIILPRGSSGICKQFGSCPFFLDEIHQVLDLPYIKKKRKEKKGALQIGWNTTYRRTLFSSWLSGHVRVTLRCETSFFTDNFLFYMDNWGQLG